MVGPVGAVLHVLFARPDHLDRSFDFTRNAHGLGDGIHIEAAPEASAQQVVVHLDFLYGQSRHLSRRGLRAGWHLGAQPDLADLRLQVHRAVHRLHRGLGQQGLLIERLDGAVALGGGPAHTAATSPSWRAVAPSSSAATANSAIMVSVE